MFSKTSMKRAALEIAICISSIIFVILVIFQKDILSQAVASYGTNVTSLSTASTGAVTGTAFALPASYASVVSWQVVADGSALSVNLEGSLDNSSWGVIDSQTTATGGIRTTPFLAVKFVRITQVSRTGGTSTTGSLTANRGFITTSNAGSLVGFSLSGNLTFSPDSTYDIGADGSNRPRHIYTGNNGRLYLGGSTSNRGYIQANADGVFQLENAAGNNFTRLQFGGTTSSFPSLARSGTDITLRLADDSGGAGIIATTVTLNALAFASLGTPSNGVLRYCSDCTITNPCAGSGTGALAKRLNGIWVCN